MSEVLGIDWAETMAERFGGELGAVSFTRRTAGAFNPLDPAGPPAQTVSTYTADGIAFSYKEQLVDGADIKKGDYQVLILRATLRDELGAVSAVLPNPGDEISVPPPGESAPKPGRIISVPAVSLAAVTVQVRGVGA